MKRALTIEELDRQLKRISALASAPHYGMSDRKRTVWRLSEMLEELKEQLR